jgi:hypothetical protein
MPLQIFSPVNPHNHTIKVFIAHSDLAWAMETNDIPNANTHLAVDPSNGDYGFYSFGDNPPPGWLDCGQIPDYPILTIRAHIARELYPGEQWNDCQGDQLPPRIAEMAEDTAFIRAWRKAAFAEEYNPFSEEEDPLPAWMAALAEDDIDIKLIRG